MFRYSFSETVPIFSNRLETILSLSDRKKTMGMQSANTGGHILLMLNRYQ